MVEELDVFEHIGPGIISRSVDLAGCLLGFRRRNEALHRSIVPDIAHRLIDQVMPWSLWCSRLSGLPLRQIAIMRASVTSWAVISAFIAQPTTRLENRSTTAAT